MPGSVHAQQVPPARRKRIKTDTADSALLGLVTFLPDSHRPPSPAYVRLQADARQLGVAPQAQVADVCVQLLLALSPQGTAAEVVDWQAAIFAFVAAHRHISTLVWISVPVASEPLGDCALSQHVAGVRHSQATSALATIMELLLNMASTACSLITIVPAPEHDPQDMPVLSDTDCIVCSMLLVLHMVTLMNYNTHDSIAATPVFVDVLSRLSSDLPDEASAAQPKRFSGILAVKVVEQLMSLLRPSMKRVPTIAKAYMDVLPKLRPHGPPDQGMTDELVSQGAASLSVQSCFCHTHSHMLTAELQHLLCSTQASPCICWRAADNKLHVYIL